MEEKIIEETKKYFDESCYVQVIKMLYQLLGIQNETTFESIFSVLPDIMKKHEHPLFDDEGNACIDVIDEMLGVHSYYLNYFSVADSTTNELKEDLEWFAQEDLYLGVIWLQNHFQIVAKIKTDLIIYDSNFDFPLVVTFAQFIEYIARDDVYLFLVHEGQNETYSYKPQLKHILYGGGELKVNISFLNHIFMLVIVRKNTQYILEYDYYDLHYRVC